MQRENERSRVVLDGRRVDNGELCSFVVIGERDGNWALYPHGAGKLGVRLPKTEAVKLAQAIIATADPVPFNRTAETFGECGKCGPLRDDD